MAYEMSSEVLSQTTECPHDFGCLDGTRQPHPVASRVGEFGVLMRPTYENWCPYKMPFGHGHLCKCPVRREIYQRYGV